LGYDSAGFTPGSDVATLSVLAYDPRETYTGRGPLEAASMGISLGQNDIGLSLKPCNNRREGFSRCLMDDFTPVISPREESREIIFDINKALGSSPYNFPRCQLSPFIVWRDALSSPETTAPHDR